MKIYAREVRADYFNWEDYLDGYMLEAQQIFIGGNRDFISLNEPLYKDAVDAIGNIYDDLEATDIYDDPGAKRRIIESYVSGSFSDEDLEAIIASAKDFFDGKDRDQAICDFLSITNNRKFVYKTIRGCSQSDWAICIYPEEHKDIISYYEAVYFNTGSEWAITCDMISSADEFDDAEVFYDYTDKWRDNDIKAWIAGNAGTDVDNVALLKIVGEHTIVKYDYEEC